MWFIEIGYFTIIKRNAHLR